MSKDHEVLFETDGRHSSVYLYAPPMDERKYGEPIDEVLDLGVDTWKLVVASGVAGVLAVLKGWAASKVGTKGTASLSV